MARSTRSKAASSSKTAVNYDEDAAVDTHGSDEPEQEVRMETKSLKRKSKASAHDASPSKKAKTETATTGVLVKTIPPMRDFYISSLVKHRSLT